MQPVAEAPKEAEDDDETSLRYEKSPYGIGIYYKFLFKKIRSDIQVKLMINDPFPILIGFRKERSAKYHLV